MVLPLDGPSELALAQVEALAVAPALPEPDGARRGGNYDPLHDGEALSAAARQHPRRRPHAASAAL